MRGHHLRRSPCFATITNCLDDPLPLEVRLWSRLAAIDLGDHVRFEYDHTDGIGDDTQPYTEGYQVKIDIFVGLNAKGPLQVDLVVGAGISAEVTTVAPATTLEIPRLVSHQYRLYPVADDLVVFATTQDIDGTGSDGVFCYPVARPLEGTYRRFPETEVRL